MKKRILIDTTTVPVNPDGLSQYIINFLKNIPDEAFTTFDLMLLINRNIQRQDMADLINSKKFIILETNIAPIGFKRDFAMYRFYKANKDKFDVFHSTSNQYPLCVKDGIATIHDITFAFYFDEPWWTFKLSKFYLNLVIKNSLKKARCIISVSDATKNTLINFYKLKPEISKKIETIYEGWEHLIIDDVENKSTDPPIDNGRYMFYVGSTRKHKNIKNLLAAFQLTMKVLPENINLLLSGSNSYLDNDDKKIIELINYKKTRLIFTGFVTKINLDSLFRNADMFIFPSLSEGFGIPVLESFYFNKPLLCSQTTSLPEIAGDAALFFDPESPKDIAEKIVYFYDHPELATQLVEKGKKRLTYFSWKKTANETFELYKSYFNIK